MKNSRTHRVVTVFACFEDGAFWEEWRPRTNRGTKRNKPVKFFADRRWRSDISRMIVPFAGSSGDFENERAALSYFEQQIAQYGGEMVEPTPQLLKDLALRFARVEESSCS
jgi:hypothetical protein